MNPLMRGMAPAIDGINPQLIQQINQITGAMRMMQNPQTAIMQMAQNNPQFAAVLQMCQGRNPRDVFYAQCKQRGIDAEGVVHQLQQAGLDIK